MSLLLQLVRRWKKISCLILVAAIIALPDVSGTNLLVKNRLQRDQRDSIGAIMFSRPVKNEDQDAVANEALLQESETVTVRDTVQEAMFKKKSMNREKEATKKNVAHTAGDSLVDEEKLRRFLRFRETKEEVKHEKDAESSSQKENSESGVSGQVSVAQMIAKQKEKDDAITAKNLRFQAMKDKAKFVLPQYQVYQPQLLGGQLNAAPAPIYGNAPTYTGLSFTSGTPFAPTAMMYGALSAGNVPALATPGTNAAFSTIPGMASMPTSALPLAQTLPGYAGGVPATGGIPSFSPGVGLQQRLPIYRPPQSGTTSATSSTSSTDGVSSPFLPGMGGPMPPMPPGSTSFAEAVAPPPPLVVENTAGVLPSPFPPILPHRLGRFATQSDFHKTSTENYSGYRGALNVADTTFGAAEGQSSLSYPYSKGQTIGFGSSPSGGMV